LTNRRQDHLDELKDKMARSFLLRFMLTEAESLGYAPYDFKIVHDDLVRRGITSPMEHLTDAAYDAFTLQRRNERNRP